MRTIQSPINAKISYSLLKWLGTLISIAALLLFSWMILEHLNKQNISAYIFANWINVLLAIFIYGLAWIPISAAWIVIARQCKITVRLPVLLNILYLSQVAKYLPGNVGQYIGRIYLANRSGIKLKSTTLAMAIEVGAILIACAILTSILFFLNFNTDTAITGHGFYDWVIKYTGIFVTLIASVLFVFFMYSNKNILQKNLSTFSIAVGLMMITVSCFAISNVVIISNLVDEFDFAISLRIFSAVVISWFIGFVTPGAPAGIGVREIVFFALLNGIVVDSSLILAAIVFRFVTIIGDLGAFLVGIILRIKLSTNSLN